MTHRGGAGNWDLSWVESDPRPTARPRGSKGLRKQEGASEGKPPAAAAAPHLGPRILRRPLPRSHSYPGVYPTFHTSPRPHPECEKEGAPRARSGVGGA